MTSDLDAAWAAVEAHYAAKPPSAQRCALGDHAIVRPLEDMPKAPVFYVLGFNGGEPRKDDDPKPRKGTDAEASRWFGICDRTAQAVDVDRYLIVERCHWGSPSVGELERRLGGRPAVVEMLALHAQANLALFAAYPPLVIWMTGLSTYMAEAVQHYGLVAVGEPQLREAPRKGRLWQEYAMADGTPLLATRHPTGARMATGELPKIAQRLAALARRREAELAR